MNIKFTAAISTFILASASVSSASAVKTENSIGVTAAPASSISATAYIVPLTILAEQTVTASDVVNSFAVTKSETDAVTAADDLTVIEQLALIVGIKSLLLSELMLFFACF